MSNEITIAAAIQLVKSGISATIQDTVFASSSGVGVLQSVEAIASRNEVFKVVCQSPSGAFAGPAPYFTFSAGIAAYYVWLNIVEEGIVVTDPAPGGTGIEAQIPLASTAAEAAAIIKAAIEGSAAAVTIAQDAETLTITDDGTAAQTDATAGTSGLSVTVIQQGGGTGVTQIQLGSIGSPGVCLFTNQDAVNYVEMSVDGTTFPAPLKIPAGRILLTSWNSAAIYARANGGPVSLKVAVFEA